MDDSVPTEDKIEWAVTQLRNHRSGGASEMRAEHLNMWLATTRKAKKDKETAEKEEATTTERKGGTENGKISEVQEEIEMDN